MAAPFVPFSVDWMRACRFWTKRGPSSVNCEHLPLEAISWVKGAGTCGFTGVGPPTPDDPKGGMLDGSSTSQKDEGPLRDSWVERPITPILVGYEILEERSKFTVYRILVTGSGGDSWVVFRRYTDFCRLNDKIKELFPSCRLALPPKRWFKDNYGEELLEERQLGLQTFLKNLTLHKHVISSEAVRHFLYLVDRPSPSESLEESRAFCETLEEANHRLQRELLENQREVDALEKTLKEKENHISLLVKRIKSMSDSSPATDTQGEGDSGVDGNEDDVADRGQQPSRPPIENVNINS